MLIHLFTQRAMNVDKHRMLVVVECRDDRERALIPTRVSIYIPTLNRGCTGSTATWHSYLWASSFKADMGTASISGYNAVVIMSSSSPIKRNPMATYY